MLDVMHNFTTNENVEVDFNALTPDELAAFIPIDPPAARLLYRCLIELGNDKTEAFVDVMRRLVGKPPR